MLTVLRTRIGACKNFLSVSRNSVRFVSSGAPSPDNEDPTEIIKAFGTYIPVLSENPLASGTSHIIRKSIPPHILRPPYAQPGYNAKLPPPPQGDGLIPLGTAEESKIRRAGALAAMALREAQSLVQVGIVIELRTSPHETYPSQVLHRKQ